MGFMGGGNSSSSSGSSPFCSSSFGIDLAASLTGDCGGREQKNKKRYYVTMGKRKHACVQQVRRSGMKNIRFSFRTLYFLSDPFLADDCTWFLSALLPVLNFLNGGGIHILLRRTKIYDMRAI